MTRERYVYIYIYIVHTPYLDYSRRWYSVVPISRFIGSIGFYIPMTCSVYSSMIGYDLLKESLEELGILTVANWETHTWVYTDSSQQGRHIPGGILR